MKRTGLPPTDEQIYEAVELRMAGFRWESVAERLHRAVDTVRKWPLRYPDRWYAAVQAGELRHAVDSEAESVVILRNLARTSQDDRVRYQAAKAIIDMRLGLGKLSSRSNAQPDTPADKSRLISELLEKYDHEQFNELARQGAEQDRECTPCTEDAAPASAV